MFSLFERLGVFDHTPQSTRFRVQYPSCGETSNVSTSCGSTFDAPKFLGVGGANQIDLLYHMSGLQRFQAADGDQYISLTSYTLSEIIVVRCPWTYDSTQGGGTIVQRFGNPFLYTEYAPTRLKCAAAALRMSMTHHSCHTRQGHVQR